LWRLYELDERVVFVDSCSSIRRERGALLEDIRGLQKSFLAATFLLIIASTAPAGGLSEVPPEERQLPPPEDSLRIADERIVGQEYNDAVPNLVDAVAADDDQLPAAEERFEIIRRARTEYVEKGREVEAQLRELISGEIPPDQVVPTAFAALRLIGQMTEILPNPNPDDLRLITNLQSRVLLTIDRRRFGALMAAAAEELDDGNYARAVEIYVNGLGEYGFEAAAREGSGDPTVAEGQARIEALLESDGIAIQIGGFNPDDYDLTGARFAAARETIRTLATGDEGPAFTSVAVPA
jgi:hypothetical protein